MKACGFFGPSGAGKTTLMEGVIRELKAAGQRVSVVKHAHQGFDIDTPGKDSWRHRQAGAFEVVVASGQRLAKLREFEAAVELNVHQLLAELVPCDWALAEGFKHADLLRVELWPEGTPAAYVEDPFVFAIVCADPARLPQPTLRPVFLPDDAAGVARYLLDHADRFEYHRG
jgi:molybdopterin-guanine dinucleotide biosynthesis protein B